jgi:transposase
MGSEIIEVVERRRRWPVEVRLRILDEVLQPGASVAAVADRHGVARGLVYQWLRQVREGRMAGLSLNKPAAATTFAPVSIVPTGSDIPRARPVPTPSLPPPAQVASAAAPTSKRRSGAVEIRLANGRIIKVDESIEAQALARLLAVVDGDRS